MIISPVFDPELVILGAGDFPKHPIPVNIMRHAPRLVCCDGSAVEYINNTKKRPWKIVGDGDSLSDELKSEYSDIFVHISEQDDNDQTKALSFARSHGFKKIAILGATGKREDHTLGNISLLADYFESGIDVRMYTDHGVFITCQGDNSFDFPVASAVSVFSFGATNISSQGLQYQLYDIKKLWQGTLNKIAESPFYIKAQGTYLVFVQY